MTPVTTDAAPMWQGPALRRVMLTSVALSALMSGGVAGAGATECATSITTECAITTTTNSDYSVGSAITGSANNSLITNQGTINSLTNSGSIIGGSSGKGVDNSGTIGSLVNQAGKNITGPYIAIFNNGGSITTLSNAGTINSSSTGQIGVYTGSGTISTLTNTGTIYGSTRGVYVDQNAAIGSIANSGSIFGGNNGAIQVYNSTSSIGTLSNSGLISNATNYAIADGGTISTLTNTSTGTIRATNTDAINVSRFITVLSNSGLISGGNNAIYTSSSGSIGTLNNSGTIIGTGSSAAGLWNGGTIGTLTNSGTITSTGQNAAVLYSSGSIGTLTNNGAIITTAASSVAITNSGGASIGTLTNNGTISSSQSMAIQNVGTISTLTNTGTISGHVNAIKSSNGTLSTITNSGLISGGILDANKSLALNGGSGSTYGTFSGGTINLNTGTLSLLSGNIWLQDNVVAARIVNSGAALKLSTAVTDSGSYSQTGGSLNIVTANNGASYGYLTVSGAATVSNTSITISGTGLTAGETFTIVRSSTSGTYSNDTVTLSGTSGLKASVSTSGNNLLVTLAGNATLSTTASSTSSAASVGAALDKLNGASSTPAALQSLITKITSLSSTTAQVAAIKSLAPAQAITPSQMSSSSTSLVSGVVGQHQLSLMEGGAGERGMAAGSEANSHNLWGQVLGGGALRGTTAAADGYRMRQFGLASGVDYAFDDNLTGGTAFSWTRTNSHGADSTATKSTLDSYQVTLYGGYRLSQLFFTGQAGVGYNRFSQDRYIAIANSTATADYGGESYQLRSQVGYDLPVGAGVTVTPLAGLTWARSVTDKYSEGGAGSANLTVARTGVNSIAQDLGVQVAWSYDTSLGKLSPDLRAAWLHDYTHAGVGTASALAGTQMTSTTPRLSPNGAQLGAGATLSSNDSLSFRAEYVGELRPDYQSHTGMIKAIWGF